MKTHKYKGFQFQYDDTLDEATINLIIEKQEEDIDETIKHTEDKELYSSMDLYNAVESLYEERIKEFDCPHCLNKTDIVNKKHYAGTLLSVHERTTKVCRDCTNEFVPSELEWEIKKNSMDIYMEVVGYLRRIEVIDIHKAKALNLYYSEVIYGKQ